MLLKSRTAHQHLDPPAPGRGHRRRRRRSGRARCQRSPRARINVISAPVDYEGEGDRSGGDFPLSTSVAQLACHLVEVIAGGAMVTDDDSARPGDPRWVERRASPSKIRPGAPSSPQRFPNRDQGAITATHRGGHREARSPWWEWPRQRPGCGRRSGRSSAEGGDRGGRHALAVVDANGLGNRTGCSNWTRWCWPPWRLPANVGTDCCSTEATCAMAPDILDVGDRHRRQPCWWRGRSAMEPALGEGLFNPPGAAVACTLGGRRPSSTPRRGLA